MFSHKLNPEVEPMPQLPRVCVARWIYAGEDERQFVNEWLNPFAEAHARCRIEGYVLDLAKGRLLAALDKSDVAPDVYDDIALLIAEPEDAAAARAFARLVRDCNPATAPNQVARGFAERKWPQLEAVCARFISAEAQQPSAEAQQPMVIEAMSALQDAGWQVRREVVGAWRSRDYDLTLEVFESLARNDPEWPVREAVADMLPTIGGEKAIKLLTYIVKSDPHPTPKAKALEGLEELALAPRPLSRAAVRTRGAVRVRGAVSPRPISPEAEVILALFDAARSQTSQP